MADEIRCDMCGELMANPHRGGPDAWRYVRFAFLNEAGREESSDRIIRHNRCWVNESPEEIAEAYRKEHPGRQVAIS